MLLKFLDKIWRKKIVLDRCPSHPKFNEKYIVVMHHPETTKFNETYNQILQTIKKLKVLDF